MILQILTDARQMLHDINTDFTQMLLVADTGKHEQLRCIDGATTQNDFLAANDLCVPADRDLHANGLRAFEDNLAHERQRFHREVGAVLHRMDVCAS